MDSGDIHREVPAGISSRKRPRAATLLQRAGAETGATALQAALREIRQLREERQQERDNFEMRLRQREEELRRLEAGVQQRIPQQLSPSDNRNNDRSNTENSNENVVVHELGYKLKPDNFDSTTPLKEFFSQFELIARANRWNDEVKTMLCVEDIESLNYIELKVKLELRVR